MRMVGSWCDEVMGLLRRVFVIMSHVLVDFGDRSEARATERIIVAVTAMGSSTV